MWISQTSREQFVDFLLEAKRTTYAGQGDEATVTPLVPGSKQLEYRDRDYLYRDIYFGMAYFVGQEVVFHREQALMNGQVERGGSPPFATVAGGERFPQGGLQWSRKGRACSRYPM
jgi:hypothetical protein